MAVSGAERVASGRSRWGAPGTQRRSVDGDVELMPGLRFVETSAPGHQSVLVTLPEPLGLRSQPEQRDVDTLKSLLDEAYRIAVRRAGPRRA